MKPTHTPICSRRHLLGSTAYSLATLGMLDLLKRDGLLASDQKGLAKPNLVPEKFDLLPKQPHFEPKAKAMISIFLLGGPSHIDMFEPNRNSLSLMARPTAVIFSSTTPPRHHARCSLHRGSSNAMVNPAWRCRS